MSFQADVNWHGRFPFQGVSYYCVKICSCFLCIEHKDLACSETYLCIILTLMFYIIATRDFALIGTDFSWHCFENFPENLNPL